ncbi:hypothetical protein ILUMI_06501 [Ignelater luminosus]|uniref:Reverse transcriptase n=1 Tax=Ignelater luminosus TaxID=2038154 RepID=A0A8K0D8A4_IGNLU|nr:hypothetical protein ILUMI_06501 [Ignelater luminosus]
MRTIIGAYSSVSAEAAQTIAGLPALHLMLEESLVMAQLKTAEEATFLGQQIRRGQHATRKARRQFLQDLSLRESQNKWKQTTKGPTTHWFFPRFHTTWGRAATSSPIKVSILIGHGEFQCCLFRIGKSEDPTCRNCDNQENDDSIHRIYGCPAFRDQRGLLRQLTRDWPISPAEFGRLMVEEARIVEAVEQFGITE